MLPPAAPQDSPVPFVAQFTDGTAAVFPPQPAARTLQSKHRLLAATCASVCGQRHQRRHGTAPPRDDRGAPACCIFEQMSQLAARLFYAFLCVFGHGLPRGGLYSPYRSRARTTGWDGFLYWEPEVPAVSGDPGSTGVFDSPIFQNQTIDPFEFFAIGRHHDQAKDAMIGAAVAAGQTHRKA